MTIETPLGNIEYVAPDNLALAQLMETLAEKLKEVGVLETERLLS